MFGNITLGQYIPGDSVIHRADPRVKIILSLIFMILIFIINTYIGFLVMGIFAITAILISGIPVGYTLKGLKPVLFIVIFTVIINLFTTKGTPILEIGLVKITIEGIDISIKLSLRLFLMVIMASILTLTTTPILLADAIESLMKPFEYIGVPSHEIAMMMTISLRFIPTLMEETDKIMKAQASRGADFDTGNFVQRAKSFIPVLVPLFVSAFKRADDMAIAMEARCYRGGKGRTRMRQLKISSLDYKIMVTCAIVTIMVIYFNV